MNGDIRDSIILNDDEEEEIDVSGWAAEDERDEEPETYARDEKVWYGPSVFILWHHTFFYTGVTKHLNTKIEVIKRYVRPGSVIWADHFTSDKKITPHSYTNESVNHYKNYTNPYNDVATQGFDRSWLDTAFC